MAKRPVYVVDTEAYAKEFSIEFTWYKGFARIQKQRSIESLHHQFRIHNTKARILEVSSFSDTELGRSLSAFRLMVTMKDGTRVPVECAYQAGKVFENGGPYMDLLFKDPSMAKTDIRLQKSGSISEFRFDGRSFSTVPRSLFYSWLYLHALNEAKELGDQLMAYNAFTDIVYNPQKSISSQAAMCALYVSLRKKNELEKALSDENYLSAVLLVKASRGVYYYDGESCVYVDKQTEYRKDNLELDPLMIDIASELNKKSKDESCDDDLKISDIIAHPIHGLGTVVGIIRDIENSRVIVHFEGIEDRKYSEKWIKTHCLITRKEEQ